MLGKRTKGKPSTRAYCVACVSVVIALVGCATTQVDSVTSDGDSSERSIDPESVGRDYTAPTSLDDRVLGFWERTGSYFEHYHFYPLSNGEFIVIDTYWPGQKKAQRLVYETPPDTGQAVRAILYSHNEQSNWDPVPIDAEQESPLTVTFSATDFPIGVEQTVEYYSLTSTTTAARKVYVDFNGAQVEAVMLDDIAEITLRFADRRDAVIYNETSRTYIRNIGLVRATSVRNGTAQTATREDVLSVEQFSERLNEAGLLLLPPFQSEDL